MRAYRPGCLRRIEGAKERQRAKQIHCRNSGWQPRRCANGWRVTLPHRRWGAWLLPGEGWSVDTGGRVAACGVGTEGCTVGIEGWCVGRKKTVIGTGAWSVGQEGWDFERCGGEGHRCGREGHAG